MRKTLLTLALAVGLLLPTSSFAQTKVSITPAERKMAEAITADQLSSYLHFVASDAMGGRDTPSQGLDVTAEFLKMNLAKWGFKPAGDNGTFFQRMYVLSTSIDGDASSIDIGGKKLKYAEDFYRMPGASGNITGKKMIYAGDGWVIKSKNLNAFAGLDIKDKVVVIYADGAPTRGLMALPKGVTQADLTGKRGVDYSDGAQYARENGAAGVVILPSTFLKENWTRLGGFFGRGGASVEKMGDDDQKDGIPTFIVSENAASAVFAGEAGDPLAGTGTAVKDINKTFSSNVVSKTERVPTQNVVAIWEGSGPLKDEMVAIGAHYDHVGTNPNAPGDDKIWNGADDDGSGTVGVLSIAEALAKAKTRPNRSILFVWHAGEEKGLWGSAYFNKFPTVDIKKVVAQLNIDMIGRTQDPNNIIKCDAPRKRCNEELSKKDEIYVIGKDMMSSELGQIVDGTNNAYLKLGYNTRYDDPKDPNRFFFRSDHFNYAMNGIPIAFWFDGVHEDYHQASDTADKIDYDKMQKVSRTIFLTMWELANITQRPQIDKKLPPELSGVR